MNLLLDTHAFLWFVWDDPKLSDLARAVISDAGNHKFISAVSYWEMAIKISLNKLDLGMAYLAFMDSQLTLNAFDTLAVALEHSAQVAELPFHHRDPFDRMLIAQALSEQMAIVSADTAFDAYPVKRIW